MTKGLMVLVLSFLFVGNVFAGELMSKEAEGYYNEALKLQQAGSYADADALYQKILIIDPYNPRWQSHILNNRGAILAQQGDIVNAEALFKKALEINPNYVPAQLNLGFIYDQRRTELESIKYWLSVLNIDLNKIKPKGYVLGEETKHVSSFDPTP